MLHDASFVLNSASGPSLLQSTPAHSTGQKNTSRRRSSVLHRLRNSVSSVLLEFSPNACTPPSPPVSPQTFLQYAVLPLESDLFISASDEACRNDHGTTEEEPRRYIDPVYLQRAPPDPLTPPDSPEVWSGSLVWREPAHDSSYERQFMALRATLDPYSLNSLEGGEPIADNDYSTLSSGESSDVMFSVITSEGIPSQYIHVEGEAGNEQDDNSADDDATIRYHVSPAVEPSRMEEDCKGKAPEYPSPGLEVC